MAFRLNAGTNQERLGVSDDRGDEDGGHRALYCSIDTQSSTRYFRMSSRYYWVRVNDSGLYRPEVLAEQTYRQFGSRVAASHRPMALLACALLIASSGLIALVLFLPTAKTATVDGVVVPARGVITVASSDAGTVETLFVREGDRIRKGDELASISAEKASVERSSSVGDTLKEVESRISSLRKSRDAAIQISNKQIAETERKIVLLEREAESAIRAIDAQHRRIAVSDEGIVRYQRLVTEKFVSDAQLQTKRGERLDLEVALESLTRTKLALEREVELTRLEKQQIIAKGLAEREAFDRELSSSRQSLIEGQTRRGYLIRAPESGTVGSLSLYAGQSLLAQTVIATIIPAGSPMKVKIFIPASVAGQAQVGTVARLRYPAFPFESFGFRKGHIESISSVAVSTDPFLPASGRTQDLFFTAILALSEENVRSSVTRSIDLRAGMKAQAELILESETLWSAWKSRLRSLKGRLIGA